MDADKIGIIGICGWGGLAINAAAIDPRIKATVASTMYEMTRVTANGYFDAANSPEVRNATRKALAEQRTADYKRGSYELAGGVVEEKTADLPLFVQQYYDYYKTPRGYHKRSLNSNGGWNKVGCQSALNTRILKYADEIQNAVMVLHGSEAHSLYMGKTAYSLLTGNNKELVIVPGATHTDLYDQLDKIPFERISDFFSKNMK